MRRLTVLALGLLAPLGACNTPNPDLVAASCPATAVLFQASSVTKLRPNGKGPADAILSADIGQAALSCDYDASDNVVDVDLRFPLYVKKGPAAGDTQRLTYFVAVLDSAGNVLSKRTFERDVANASATFTEEVSGTQITLAREKKPYDYQILTGFQLTADELAYNRVRRDQRP